MCENILCDKRKDDTDNHSVDKYPVVYTNNIQRIDLGNPMLSRQFVSFNECYIVTLRERGNIRFWDVIKDAIYGSTSR